MGTVKSGKQAKSGRKSRAVTSEAKVTRAHVDAAVWVPIVDLVPWVGNPKKPTKAEIAGVAASIRKFGFGAPVVARKANLEIIAGHTRALAAKSAGLVEVPVRLLDLNEHDAHLLALADNELGAEWDPELLLEQLEELSAEDRALAGFQIDEPEAPEDVTPQLSGLQYRVVVECADEDAQTALLEKLEAEGHTCSPLIS